MRSDFWIRERRAGGSTPGLKLSVCVHVSVCYVVRQIYMLSHRPRTEAKISGHVSTDTENHVSYVC